MGKYGIGNEKYYLYDYSSFNYTEHEIHTGVQAFKNLINNQESALQNLKKQVWELIKNDPVIKMMEEAVAEEYRQELIERESENFGEILRLQRYALCVSIYSFLEGKLGYICNEVEKNTNSLVKINDLSGQDGDIKKFWNYLLKVCNLNLKSVEKYYHSLLQQKIVRNIIAHHDGYFNDSKIGSFFKVDGVMLDIHKRVNISDVKYLIFLLDNLGSMLIDILKLADQKIKNDRLNA